MLGLPGPSVDVVATTIDKSRFRKFQADAGLPHPRFTCLSADDPSPPSFEGWVWPLIVKPVDSSGSRGVVCVEDPDHLDAAVATATEQSRSGRVVVEEFVVGTEVGGDLFLVDGEVVSLAITNKHLRGFVVTGHSLPSALDPASQRAVVTALTETCRRIGLAAGPVNFDVMVDPRQPGGPAVVLEISPRTGGNGIPELIHHATGFDAHAATIDQALGLPVTPPERHSVRPCGSSVFGSDVRGVLVGMNTPTTLGHPDRPVHALWSRRRPGEPVDVFDNAGESVGYAVFGCRSVADYTDAVSSLDRALDLEVRPVKDHSGGAGH